MVLAPMLVSTFDTRLTVSIAEELDGNIINKWLRWNHQALEQAFGSAPSKPYRIIVSASHSGSNSYVPWGQVNRRELANQVHLVINPGATYEQLISDWTAYHEYSHLLIPYQGWGDLWFSEGLASYYQNILQYRMGVLTQSQARQKLLDGLQRGMDNNPAPTLSLGQLSSSMRRYRAYMRVYWSGAWYFWKVDQALRERDLSLDQALNHLNNCCAKQSLSAKQMISELDSFSDSDLFSSNFQHAARSTRLAVDTETWHQLQTMVWPRKKGDQRGFLNGDN